MIVYLIVLVEYKCLALPVHTDIALKKRTHVLISETVWGIANISDVLHVNRRMPLRG
jgi:hypothetical protein